MINVNKQQITQNISAPNKDMEILKKHFSHCFDKSGNFDFDKFKIELSKNEIEFSKESYSMDWLGKSYARLLASDEATTLLKENEEWNKKEENKNSQNLLIKGDNLEVLKHLSNAYYEKIKMIYIDPPYNTGSDDFVYQDDRKFTVEEFSKLAGVDEEKAKRILEFVDSESNSHSAWLTFMYPRLYIAKQLLKDDGVIFVSIDNNEVAQLRLLMDEIFGEENVMEMIWRKSGAGRDGKMKNTTTFRIDHEYILVGFKNELFLNKSFEKPNWINSYGNPDNDTRGNYKAGSISKKEEASNPNHANYYTVVSPSGKKFTRQFDISKEDFIKLDQDNRIYWGKNSDAVPAIKIFENEKRRVTTSSLIDYKEITTTIGSKELEAIISVEKIGENLRPKPTSLLNKLLILGSNRSDIILDFFAGSGTTGDAVMQLNAEDRGNRKYILVQLPEPIDPKKNKTAYDFIKNELKIENPTIFEITKERLIRASKKIKTDAEDDLKNKKEELKKVESKKKKTKKDEEKITKLQEEINKLEERIENIKKQDLNFKIFETTPIWEDYNFEAEEFDPQIKLFDESKLSDEDLKTLLTTWKTYDGILLTDDLKEIDLDGYKGYYFKNKLYLMNRGFKTENLKKLLNEIDENKDFNPATIIVFGYNFESKVLREIAETVKSYANKKNIDIDVITRY